MTPLNEFGIEFLRPLSQFVPPEFQFCVSQTDWRCVTTEKSYSQAL